MVLISTHFPPPVITDRTASLAATTHMLCCSWGIYFSAAASSENCHGSMNLASNTALPSTRPSRVAAIHRKVGCRRHCWTSVITRPVWAWYQRRFSFSVASPSCAIRLPDRSSGSISPLFSRHSRSRAAWSSPMTTRASEPPMKLRLFAESAIVSLYMSIALSPGRLMCL
jgi:hypothetical protein